MVDVCLNWRRWGGERIHDKTWKFILLTPHGCAVWVQWNVSKWEVQSGAEKCIEAKWRLVKWTGEESTAGCMQGKWWIWGKMHLLDSYKSYMTVTRAPLTLRFWRKMLKGAKHRAYIGTTHLAKGRYMRYVKEFPRQIGPIQHWHQCWPF